MSTPANSLGRVRGAASLHYKDQDFWTKDVMAMEVDLKPFKIMSQGFGSLSRRQGGRLVQIKFTPTGVWTAAQLAVLFPAFLVNPRLGDFVTPTRTVTAVNTGTGALTVTGHQFISGTGVRFGSRPGATLPTGINPNVTYYINCPDANTVLLYDSEVHALAGGGPGLVTPSAAGSVASGNVLFIHNSPLIVTTTDGVQLTVWNAAITAMPDLSLGATESVLKQVTIEGYTLNGTQWSDANSLYTLATGVLGAVPPQQTQIPTVPFTIDWATRLVVTADNTTADSLTIANHGFNLGDTVVLDTLSPGATIPVGLAAGTTYYVIKVDANTIKLATTSGNATAGTAIDITADESGTVDVLLTSGNLLTGLQARDMIEVAIKATLADVMTNGNGLLTRSITEVEATIGFVPDSLDYGTVIAQLNLQGGAAALGQALPMANLDIYGPNENPFLRIYGASLTNAPARFGAEADRVDKLTFVSNRTFRGNAQNPVAYVGVAAPTV